MNIRSLIGSPALGVLAYYRDQKTVVHICSVQPKGDNSLHLFFPKGHALRVGDLATIHLDNRTGVADYDAELRVYRMSYKGEVVTCDGDHVVLHPRECQVFYGNSIELEIRQSGYAYPPDQRTDLPLPWTDLKTAPLADGRERDNKVGVLITMAPEQPHTTVLAFLSSVDDDVFFITQPNSYKAQLLRRDPHCFFAIDSRATFSFERALEWNYTLIEADAALVPKGITLFEDLRAAFIAKNPWEIGFFTLPDLDMYHLKNIGVMCPGTAR